MATEPSPMLLLSVPGVNVSTPLTGGASDGHVITSVNNCVNKQYLCKTNSSCLHISVLIFEFLAVMLMNN